MNKKIQKEAEDILSEEKISEDKLETLMKQCAGTDKTQTEKAIHIYNFLKVPNFLFSPVEKEDLKNRIQGSVKKLNKRKRIQRWASVAAIFIVGLFGGYGIYNHFSDPDIVNFAKNLEELGQNEETRLFLQGGQEVLIKNQESTIKYEKSGKNINIGTEENIVQKLDTKKPVYNTVVVPYGKKSQITLCEGTKVWLNSGSKLVYPAVFENSKREVFIEGEAIFEVSHNDESPFFVNSRDFAIKVTGTVFNVSSYADDSNSSAVLEHGKIEILSNSKSLLHRDKVEMAPGEMVTFDPEKGTFEQKSINPHDYMSWRKGYYVFKSEKLSSILKKIARYYNVEIQMMQVKWSNETFTGSLDLRSSPEEVLKIIKKTIPIEDKYEEGKILIY